MLKIVHVVAGGAALLLSFIPGLRGAAPLLMQPEAVALAFVGLLNLQAAANRLSARGPQPPLQLAAALGLLLAAALQTLVLLVPATPIAGQPGTLASLVLALIATLLQFVPGKPAHQPRRSRPARQPQRTDSASGRETGTVKWFNTSKGFGFISRDTGDDIFVHFRAIRGEGHRVLIEGQRVEFTVMQRDKGLQAEDVVATAYQH
ncbi:cold-shock protein [Stutzerimonas nosocomialis]|uniref:Cold-shock protein n=1 Tax=Stutzerimonas nosocomialis TaxID=1056496 RepID=A0A5R9QFD6_9GAMM|nr:cold-shock protein [Stutzerimonas nosocomialis]TLX55823.1 cold-shock protein [Stutzerimonas nosocomialis]TLX63879.1 cold-shock protein [Stutzerimonas nosocomialis]